MLGRATKVLVGMRMRRRGGLAARVQSGGAHVERGELDAVVLEISKWEAGRAMLGAPRESTEPSSGR